MNKSVSTAFPLTILVLQKPAVLPQWAQSEGEEEAMKDDKAGSGQEKSLFVGQQVLLKPAKSFTVPTLLWWVLGRAVRSRTRPSGEFRFAESDGQFQVLLLLLGQPGQPLLLLPLALALCPLYHVFLCWILLQHTNTHITRFRGVKGNNSGTKTDSFKRSQVYQVKFSLFSTEC